SRERDEEFAKMPDDDSRSDRDKMLAKNKKKEPDYIMLRTAEDLEQEQDAKEKENSGGKQGGSSRAPEKDPKMLKPDKNEKNEKEKKKEDKDAKKDGKEPAPNK
ncbi:hypothetical protein PFISCL1PPCAC_13318, partial [Pristionchus fissidentatus]